MLIILPNRFQQTHLNKELNSPNRKIVDITRYMVILEAEAYALTAMRTWPAEICRQIIDNLVFLQPQKYTRESTLVLLRSMQRRRLWWMHKGLSWCSTSTTRCFTQENSTGPKWRRNHSSDGKMVLPWLTKIEVYITFGSQSNSHTLSNWDLSAQSSLSRRWTTLRSISIQLQHDRME